MNRSQEAEKGMTLIETIGAIALLGLAVLTASSLLAAYPRTSERLAAHGEMLRVLDATVESLRAGVLPLESASVPPPIPSTRIKRVAVSVASRQPHGLFEIRVSTRCVVRGQSVQRHLETIIWRPS